MAEQLVQQDVDKCLLACICRRRFIHLIAHPSCLEMTILLNSVLWQIIQCIWIFCSVNMLFAWSREKGGGWEGFLLLQFPICLGAATKRMLSKSVLWTEQHLGQRSFHNPKLKLIKGVKQQQCVDKNATAFVQLSIRLSILLTRQ